MCQGRHEIENAILQFVGEIQQRPPAHSAVKIGGRRAYKLARAGKAFELVSRPVTIHRLEICRYEYPELELDIECGSGTYVRALGRDLAEALGTAAVMSALDRTAIGRFRIEDAIAMDDLKADTLLEHLQPALTAVADLPRVELSAAELTEIRNGRPIMFSNRGHLSEAGSPSEWAAMNAEGQLAAILREKRPGELWPDRNFL